VRDERTPRPVLNKRQNYDLWTSGAFGNQLCTWRRLSDWIVSDYEGKVALRVLGHGGGPCTYYLDPCEVSEEIRRFVLMGVSENYITINEMAPDERLILNGEFLADVLPDGRWGHLHYSRLPKPMRISLREAPEEASGLAAREILRSAMTPGSWEDFEELSRSYQGHVVELSVYDHCLGDVPGRNTLIWEVRRY